MQNELTKLFDERQALRESLLQLSDSLNNEGIEALHKQEKEVQWKIEDIIYDWEDSHGS